VTGSMKYDTALSGPNAFVDWLQAELKRSHRGPVVVAGSVIAGEEMPVLEAFRSIQQKWPQALLILAPRKPERFAAAGEIVAQAGWHAIRRSGISLDGPLAGILGNAANADQSVLLLDTLGEGQHFGEWWGRGIQRNYSQTERHFSLFNTRRWGVHYDNQGRVGPCRVVPTLYEGPMEDHGVMKGLQYSLRTLQTYGSAAAPGFMRPEGIVIYHRAGNSLWKKTLERDEEPKGKPMPDLMKNPAFLEALFGKSEITKVWVNEAVGIIPDSFPGATKSAEGGR